MGNLAHLIDQSPALGLESRMDRLGLESSYMANLITSFSQVIPELKERMATAFTSLQIGKDKEDLSEEVRQVQTAFKNVEKKIPHASFLNVSKMLVSVPEGFSGDLVEYLKFLNLLSGELTREANGVLSEYNSILASFVSNKQDKISLRDHTALFKKVKQRREHIINEIKNFFPDSSVGSKKRLSDVCERFNDFPEIMKLVEQLGRDRKNHNLKEISDTVRQCVEMLDIVVRDVRENGIENVSGAAAMNISEGAYEVGKFVELLALYRNMVDQAITATNRIFEQLDSVL